jgi:DNA processing protein
MAERGLLDFMICRIPGLRLVEKAELCRKFDKEDEFSILSKRDLESFLNCPPVPQFWSMDQIRALAEKDEAAARRMGIKTVSLRESAYPPLLSEIYDPPVLLFYRGVLPPRDRPLAAVVGTRRPSAEAAVQAYRLGKELGRVGVAVVSGLALGIDALAHRGNIEAGAPTVAVLGCGPDRIYPLLNRDLARRILSGGGVILSEYPPGTELRKWNFPARNRIISGLVPLTVIVEAPEKSGALITASFALEQNRELCVASAGISSLQGKGTARLAEEGARVVSSADEILSEWGLKQNSFRETGEESLALSLARELNIKL